MWFQVKKPNTNQMVSTKQTGALTREVAGVASDLYAPLDAYLGVRSNRDPLLSTRRSPPPYDYPYGLLEEALDKDAHLAALIAQRKAAVLS